MSVHLEAKPGDYADIVLLPGDPLRAEFAATHFLENPLCVNHVRGMLGYTGTYRGRRISVQGSGMGIPSISIYAHELIHDYGVKTLIRIGSCGSFQERIGVRGLIIAMSACTDSAHNRLRFNGCDYAPAADAALFRAACRLADQQELTYHAGPILSSDTFYQDDPEGWKRWAAFGVLGVEMEASALYTLSAQAGARALAICTVSDSLVSGESLSATDRQSSFDEMITLALTTAVEEAT